MSGGGGGGNSESAEARALYGTLGDISREQWESFREVGLPLWQDVARSAREETSPGAIAGRVSQAGADVAQSYRRGQQALTRDLGRYGINPGSGRWLAARGMHQRDRSADQAGAMTLERRAASGERFGRMLSALSPGQGMAAGATSGLASAAGGLGQMGAARSQQRANMWGGLGSLAGGALTAFALSDPEVKTDVRQVGETADGLGVYRYRFLGEPQEEVGVMADEVQEKKPQAVAVRGGLRMVDYGKV